MTESGWLACDDPRRMLDYLTDTTRSSGSGAPSLVYLGPRRRISDRKLRLFACACCWMTGITRVISTCAASNSAIPSPRTARKSART